MATTIAAPAAPAPAAPAPAAAPAAAAPVAAPAPAPAAAPVASPAAAPAQRVIGTSGVKSAIDPNQYPILQDYEKAVMEEKLAAIAQPTDQAPAEVEAPAVVEDPAGEASPVEVPAPDAVAEATKEEPAKAEEDFDFDPPKVVTPEALSQMVTENPEFGKLLEADPRLKGQLYKTAREAAELAPYKEILPDLESAKTAVADQQTYRAVDDAFLGATTKEGTQAALAKIMELSYERDDSGNVVMQDGKPVVGPHFFGFVDNLVAMDLENRKGEVQARLEANQYHVGAKTQEEADGAYARDAARLQHLDELLSDGTEASAEALPPALQAKAAELDRREREINERQHGGKVEERATFEKTVVADTQGLVNRSITSAIATAKKNGAAISPYLEEALPRSMGSKLMAAFEADEGLNARLKSLQRLPANDSSRQRRRAEIDRAVQHYLPGIAKATLEAAGVQVMANAEAKKAKVDAQAKATTQTEISGSRGASGAGAATMSAKDADTFAQAEWQKANPGKPFDRAAQTYILPRVLQLMTAR